MQTTMQQLENRNFRHLVMDVAWFALAMTSTTRFLQFFAIRLGADAITLGLISSLPALILIVSTGFSQWWRDRHRDSVKAVWWPSIGFRLVFILPAFTPFFPSQYQVWWLVGSTIVPAMWQGIASAVFMVMMRETVTERRIAALFSRRQLAVNMMLLLGLLVFGVLLETLPFPLNYQVMFVLAFAFSMISQWHLGKVALLVEAAPQSQSKRTSLDLLRDPHFQAVAYITLVAFIGFFSIFAVTPLFLERNLGAAEGYIAIFGAVELVAGALMMAFIEPLLIRYGSRMVISGGLVVTALAALAIALAPSLTIALLGAALTGMGWNATYIAVLRFYTERTHADDMRASTLLHQMIFMAQFIGPLIGSIVAEWGMPLVLVLLIGGVIRLFGALLTHYGLALFGRRKMKPLV